MINRNAIKLKTEELAIPFSNLLSGVVSEKLIQILEAGQYKRDIWVCNGEDFTLAKYKEQAPRNIYCVYGKVTEEPLPERVFPEILKYIMSVAGLEGFKVNGAIRTWGLKLEITVDDMYVPIQLFIDKIVDDSLIPEEENMRLSMEADKTFKYLAFPKEQVLAKHLFEIIRMLELINEMNHYYDAYKILTEYPVNGRKVKDSLMAMCQDKNININTKRIEMLKGFGNYTYMKKKWKVQLRQKNKSEPSWSDLMECLISFLGPIWETMENGTVFIGDWMPQLKRFLG